MTLEEYVLTYKDKDGNVVINVADYYDRYISPLESRFSRWSLKTNSTVLCCFKDHSDINPSLGTIQHKFYKGVRIYHCLGCGATGTVLRLHQRIQLERYGRTISERESALELCKLFGVDARAFEEIKDAGDQTGHMETLRKLDSLMGHYTIADYKRDILSARTNPNFTLEDRANAVNIANVKFIATSKKLYD